MERFLKSCIFEKKDKMGSKAIKLELIEWLTKLEDEETLNYLKVVKDCRSSDGDWWNDLTDNQKQGIERGLLDIDEGKLIPHDEVMDRYGL